MSLLKAPNGIVRKIGTIIRDFIANNNMSNENKVPSIYLKEMVFD